MCAHNALAKKPEISDINCRQFLYIESMRFMAEILSRDGNREGDREKVHIESDDLIPLVTPKQKAKRNVLTGHKK